MNELKEIERVILRSIRYTVLAGRRHYPSRLDLICDANKLLSGQSSEIRLFDRGMWLIWGYVWQKGARSWKIGIDN